MIILDLKKYLVKKTIEPLKEDLLSLLIADYQMPSLSSTQFFIDSQIPNQIIKDIIINLLVIINKKYLKLLYDARNPKSSITSLKAPSFVQHINIQYEKHKLRKEKIFDLLSYHDETHNNLLSIISNMKYNEWYLTINLYKPNGEKYTIEEIFNTLIPDLYFDQWLIILNTIKKKKQESCIQIASII